MRHKDSVLTVLEAFLDDPTALDMYIEGEAGTGKTTKLGAVIAFAKDKGLKCIVTAYTHKACGVLRAKVPTDTEVMTLHAWLKKRPTVNHDATRVEHIDGNSKIGRSELVPLIVVDEFSAIGESDLKDIRAEQTVDNKLMFKLLWLGDPNQLPPVQDKAAIQPGGKYHVKLTKQHRQDTSSPLYCTLQQIIQYIHGARPIKALAPHKDLIRGVDLVEAYRTDKEDKVLLAYTNETVEELNRLIQGYSEPKTSDVLFSPTTKHRYIFKHLVNPNEIYELDRPFGPPLSSNDKYNTLDFICSMANSRAIQFALVHDLELDEEQTVAFIFGHYQYKLLLQELKLAAANSNAAIEHKHKLRAGDWVKANAGSVLARVRAAAWREFLAVDQNCMCLDFAHALTVHKSQGSTYTNVYVDTQDLSKAAKNLDLYLKLVYVAFSRASSKVFTN